MTTTRLASLMAQWKNQPANAGDMSLITVLGRNPGGGNGNPIYYSGKSHGQRNLVGYSPWGCKELDTATKHNNKHNTTKLITETGCNIVIYQ